MFEFLQTKKELLKSTPTAHTRWPRTRLQHRFEVEDLPWHLTPRRDEFWYPLEATPWFFVPSFSELPMRTQMRYSQLYALGCAESIMALESDFIVPIINDLLEKPSRVDENLRISLRQFCAEEEKHAEMFHQLLLASEPDWYRRKSRYLTDLSPVKTTMKRLDFIRRNYQFFGVWIWIAIFFEERSLLMSQAYIRSKEERLSPLHLQVHRAHMLEEVHHVQWDEVFIEELYRPLPSWNRTMTAFLTEKIVKSFASPQRMSKAIARQLTIEYPQFEPQIKKCLGELKGLLSNVRYQQMAFAPIGIQRTVNQLKKFPEMNRVLKVLR